MWARLPSTQRRYVVLGWARDTSVLVLEAWRIRRANAPILAKSQAHDWVVGSVNVRDAIRGTVREGQRLPTPSRRSTFGVAQLDHDAITILIGPKKTAQRIPWSLLDETLAQVPRDRWMPIGAVHSSDSADGTLEALLKPSLHRSVANYVAALLATANLVQLETEGTHRVRRL